LIPELQFQVTVLGGAILMTIKQLVTILGGLVIGVVMTLAVLFVFKIPLESFGPVNMAATVILFGLVGMIGLDSALKAGFISN
jgi:hypothetical protein